MTLARHVHKVEGVLFSATVHDHGVKLVLHMISADSFV